MFYSDVLGCSRRRNHESQHSVLLLFDNNLAIGIVGQEAYCLYALFESSKTLLDVLYAAVYFGYLVLHLGVSRADSLVNLAGDDAVVLYCIGNGRMQRICQPVSSEE